jgi:hypothetical protein
MIINNAQYSLFRQSLRNNTIYCSDIDTFFQIVAQKKAMEKQNVLIALKTTYKKGSLEDALYLACFTIDINAATCRICMAV